MKLRAVAGSALTLATAYGVIAVLDRAIPPRPAYGLDPVEAAAGRVVHGSQNLTYMSADGRVHYFAHGENVAAYLAHPERYPDPPQPAVNIAAK